MGPCETNLVAGMDVKGDEVLCGSVEEKTLTKLRHVEHEPLHYFEHVAYQDIALQLSEGIREDLYHPHLCKILTSSFIPPSLSSFIEDTF